MEQEERLNPSLTYHMLDILFSCKSHIRLFQYTIT